jgi:tetratricopeptide (TPR) repeat protein
MVNAQSGEQSRAAQLLADGHAANKNARVEAAYTNYSMALAAARADGDKAVEGRALVALAHLVFHHNPHPDKTPFELRKAYGEEALALFKQAGDKAGEASALRILASIAGGRKAIQHLERSLVLSEELGDKEAIASSLERLGATLALADQRKAQGYKERSLALFREIGDKEGEAHAHFGLAVNYMGTDRPKMREHAQAAMALYRETGCEKQVAQMLMFLAWDDMPLDEQEAYWSETLEICRRLRIDVWAASALDSLGDIAEKRGDHARAAALRAESAAIRPPEPELAKELEEAMEKDGKGGFARALKRVFLGADVEEDEEDD